MKNKITIFLYLFIIFPLMVCANNKTFINSIGMKFILIPKEVGKYYKNKDFIVEKDFYIQSTEVTQEQWKRIMNFNPSFHKCNKCPVENVSYSEIQSFIRRLNIKEGIVKYRLPTYREWQYTSIETYRKIQKKKNDSTEYFWYYINSGGRTHKVAQKKSVMGVYDMFGNVSEMTNDTSFHRIFNIVLGGNFSTSIGHSEEEKLQAGKGYKEYGFRLYMDRVNIKSKIKKDNVKPTNFDSILNNITKKGFGKVTIDLVDKMDSVVNCNTKQYFLQYGKVDKSIFRKENPYNNDDDLFIEIDYKYQMEFDDLHKKMKNIGFKKASIDLLGNNFTINWISYYKDYGCLITYFAKNKKLLIRWKKLSSSWFKKLNRNRFLNEEELKNDIEYYKEEKGIKW